MGERAGDPLLTGLAQGSAAAFAALYDRFAAALFRTARTLLGSREDAEDAVQDVFVGLARARRALAGVENLRAYLFAALRRAAAHRGAARRRGRAVPLDGVAEPAAAAPRAGGERAERLERALH